MLNIEYTYKTRVRYKDIDAMGIVYYSRYYEFFEAARSDMLREMGLPYGEFEKSGFMMPVVESHCKYFNGATFDDLLKINCRINQYPKARLKINYLVENDQAKKIAEGYTVHGFLDENGNVRRAPQSLLKLFDKQNDQN